MLGDSTMFQASRTMINSLLPLDFAPGAEKRSCRSRFAMAHADTLVGKRLGAWNRGKHFAEIVRERQPDVVVMGASPHVYGEANYVMMVNEVLNSIARLRVEFPHIQFVWRTNQPAGKCDMDGADQSAGLPELPPDAYARRVRYKQFNWDSFYGRDLYAISRLGRYGVPVMDLRMLYSRTDSHPNGDCLHYCSPGPLDVVPLQFQNLLENGL